MDVGDEGGGGGTITRRLGRYSKAKRQSLWFSSGLILVAVLVSIHRNSKLGRGELIGWVPS